MDPLKKKTFIICLRPINVFFQDVFPAAMRSASGEAARTRRRTRTRSLVFRFRQAHDKARQVGIEPALLPEPQQEQEEEPDQEQEQEQEQDALGSNYFSLNLFVQNGNA